MNALEYEITNFRQARAENAYTGYIHMLIRTAIKCGMSHPIVLEREDGESMHITIKEGERETDQQRATTQAHNPAQQ